MEQPLALITGAGRGIGRAIALGLSRAGYAVVLVARSNEEITELRNEIIARGGQAYATPCDITVPAEVNALRNDIESELGPLSVLINNAGVAPSSKFENITDEMWRETFAVNVDGVFFVTRAFLPGMVGYRVQGIGYSQKAETSSEQAPDDPTPYTLYPIPHVISIGSTASLEGFRYTAAYTASKHALLGMMRALAKEYGKSPVIFSTICPGFTRTQILAEAIQAQVARGTSSEKAEAMFAMMNHAPGAEGRIIEPEEIADTVLAIINAKNVESGRAYYVGTLEPAA